MRHITPEEWAERTWKVDPWGSECPAAWYVLYAPQRYQPADWLRGRLEREGFKAFYPERAVWRRERGGDRKRVKVWRPELGSVVFAEFDRTPRWDVLRAQRVIADVARRGDAPAALTRREMAQVRGFEDAISALVSMDFNAGDMVEVTRGAFEGWNVPIAQIEGDFALLGVELLGKQIKVKLTDIEKG